MIQENSFISATYPARRTPSIVALNAVSTMAQVGQFDLATTLLPIALKAKKASPNFIVLAIVLFNQSKQSV